MEQIIMESWMEKIYEVELRSFAYGGEAIGRLPDGRAVFVPFAMPGEKVRLELVEEKRAFARARLLEVLEPAPQRIPARCAHFGLCGGCHYQHLPYPAQLAAKTAILRDQLERIGGLKAPPVQPAVASPQEYRYRNHVQFHLTPQGALGYHKPRSNEVFAIQECHLPEPALNTLWPQLAFEPLSEIERIALRLGADDELQIILESRDPAAPDLSVEELPVSVVHLSPAGALVLAGSLDIHIAVLGRSFQVSAGSFFQTNTAIAQAMVEHVLALLGQQDGLSPAAVALDVYCGVGLFSAFLASHVGRLVGIEAAPSAADDFSVNLDEFDNVELYEAPAEAVLPGLDLRPDLILVDPPREGIQPAALDGLLRLAAPRLVYVSCDPATLGRDARRLSAAGYQLETITLFDQFPQTYHIESISLWVKT
jgi:23S rRNA (uracil1939-C5)-methyltransferase